MTQDALTAKAVADAIGSTDQLAARATCRTLEELTITLERGNASAVVVDIDPRPAQMLTDLESIINRAPATRFVVLCSENKGDLMLQAMQVGVRHYMVKDKIKSDLLAVLQRLSPPSGGSRNGVHGQMATILSAGGGCGATTFAINLATELRLLTSQPTLLVDLDCNYGAAAGYLGATAQYGIADVLSDGDRIDAQLIRTTVVQHSDHIHLLASPATIDLENPAPLAYQHLGRVVQRVREIYPHTVIDAPRVPMPVAALLANASQMTYIVLQMNVENIRVARAMYSVLLSRGVPQDRMLPIVNRYRGRREMISIEDAKRAIGCESIGYLNNDYKGVISSINFGKPLYSAAPRSPLRIDIQNLARSLQPAPVGRPLAGAAR